MKFRDTVKIGCKEIGGNNKVFIIAEAGVNHNGDMKLAKKLIDVASESGVDAIKFQSFKTESLILDSVKKAGYQLETTQKEESQYQMLKKIEVSKENMRMLKNYCNDKGVIFLTTPFDEESLEELDDFDLDAYKVSSTDLTNIPFLKKIAAKKKPLLLSTGMSYMSEIENALYEIRQLNSEIVLFQCISNYPMNEDCANFNVINTFKNKFDILVGYSDHSEGIGVGPYTIPMGISVIEKHFTLDKSMEGPDHRASLSPDELKEFVKQVRRVETFMGSGIKKPLFSELGTRSSLQKCLVSKTVIAKGEIFSELNIIAKRTGGKGISPIYYNDIIGKRSDRDYDMNEIIDFHG